jgi:hypothetical protein
MKDDKHTRAVDISDIQPSIMDLTTNGVLITDAIKFIHRSRRRYLTPNFDHPIIPKAKDRAITYSIVRSHNNPWS